METQAFVPRNLTTSEARKLAGALVRATPCGLFKVLVGGVEYLGEVVPDPPKDTVPPPHDPIL